MRHRLIPTLLALPLALSATACSGRRESSESNASSDTAASALITELAGSAIATQITDRGETTRPLGGSKFTLVIPAQSGEPTTIPVTVDADGKFSAQNVPEGRIFVRIDGPLPRFIYTSARTFDLGGVDAGRPDAEIAKNQATAIVMNTQGLSPWQEQDTLLFFSLGAGVIGMAQFSEHAPARGDTSLRGARMLATSALLPPRLIDSAKGDVTYIGQIVAHTVGGGMYQSLAKVLRPASLTMTDGQTATISGAFVDVPQQKLSLRWMRSAFAQQAASVHPQARSDVQTIALSVQPGGAARRLGRTPALAFAADGTPTDAGFDMVYGNPFPASWPVVGTASVAYGFQVQLPGAQQKVPIIGFAETAVIANGQVLSLAPTLGPVQNLRVNGQDVKDARSGIGQMPTITWSRPALGNATGYVLTIHSLEQPQPGLPVATIYTDETTVPLPPGLLEQGKHYALEVRGDAGLDVTKPFQHGVEGASSVALSNVVTP